jgi:hypothetical protein
MKLVTELKPEEAAQSEKGFTQEHIDILRDEHFIIDPKLSAQVVTTLLKVKSPLVLEFLHDKGVIILTVFVNKNYPAVKFLLDNIIVTKGKIGDLLASDEVIKVVSRVDTLHVNAALRILTANGIRARNFLDISVALKANDYWLYGKSIFKSSSQGLRDVYRKFGLETPLSKNLENCLTVFLHLSGVLPKQMMEVAVAKAQVDLDINGQVCVPEAKEAKKQLRNKLENLTIHIICQKGDAEEMKAVVTQVLNDKGLPFQKVLVLGKYAFVQLEHQVDKAEAIGAINKQELSKDLQLQASEIDLKTVIAPNEDTRINVLSIEKSQASTAEKLDELGYSDLTSMPQNVERARNAKLALPMEEYETLFQQ